MLRRSSRTTKKVNRYGMESKAPSISSEQQAYDPETLPLPPSPVSLSSMPAAVSRKSSSSSSSRRLLKAQAQLEAAKKLQALEDRFEQEKLERQKNIISLELESKLAVLEQESSSSSKASSRADLLPALHPTAAAVRTSAWVTSQVAKATTDTETVKFASITAGRRPDYAVQATHAIDVPVAESDATPELMAHTVDGAKPGKADLVSKVCSDREAILQKELQQLQYELAVKEEAYHRSLNAAYTYSQCHVPMAQPPPAAPPEQKLKQPDNKFLARQALGKDLPVFTGQPEEWPIFIAMYRSTTAECGFSPTENLIRLQKCLRGKAREAVVGLLAVPGNTEHVIQTLELRFGRAELVVSALITRTKALKPVKPDDFECLISLSTAVQTLVATMRQLNAPGHLHNPQLRQDLVSKLPPNLQLQWGDIVRSSSQGDINLSTFSVWLQQIAVSASHIHIPPSRPAHDFKHRRSEMTFAAAEPTKPPQAPAFKPKCAVCGATSHQSIATCLKFTDKSVQERWAWVKAQQRCFTCLGKGHRVRDCPSRRECPVPNCNRHHHRLLHASATRPELCALNQPAVAAREILLRVAPVTLHGPAGDVHTTALFDEGSTVTLIDASLANEIGATGTVTPLTLAWTDSQQQSHPQSQCVDLWISGSNDKMHRLHRARTVTDLHLPCSTTTASRVQSVWPHLAHVPATSMTEPPRILIGQDNISLTISREVVEGPPNAPVASRTLLGWVIHGNAGMHRNRVDKEFTFHSYEKDVELHDLVKQSFRTENFGVAVHPDSLLSRSEKRAKLIQTATTVRSHCGARWKTGLLWKDDNPIMPPSKQTAMNRLLSLERKMSRLPAFALQYSAQIEQYVTKHYAEKLSPEEAASEPPKTWYLPHFGVTNPNKPGKLRFVFDAAAKSGGRSLNDALLSGPDLLRPLPTVLFGFRERPIAFGGDIAEMFHQVDIQESDRCSQRFLWRTDTQSPPDVYHMKVMTFGATSSPSSALHVKNHNVLQHPDTSQRLQTAIVDRHYMDDYFDSTDTVKEAITLAADVTRIHRDGGFMIRHWISNSPAVVESIPEALRAKSTTVGLDVDRGQILERTLGLKWDTSSDVLKVQPAERKTQPTGPSTTKRQALSTVMAVFDPLGLLSSFTIRARVILQDIWRSGIGWDDELPSSIKAQWDAWCNELQSLNDVSIPRCYSLTIPTVTNIQLHTFCDASEKAFGAAVYWRFTFQDCSVSTALVTAKARVAPLKPLSIPRLELQAAVLGARLASFVLAHHSYSVEKSILWSDSQTVLCWIKADARCYKPFVSHRVGEIKERTSEDDWRWVPTADNVADDLSRGTSVSDLTNSSRWFSGPEYLRQNPSEWPVKSSSQPEVDDDVELKREFAGVAAETSALVHVLPDVNRFSSWVRLVRATAYVLKFIAQLKARVQGPTASKSGEILPSEFRAAQRLWWQQVQYESFATEYNLLKKGKPIPSTSKLAALSLRLSDNIMTVHGRTDNVPHLPTSAKNPVLLDASHRYTQLLILQLHEWAGHQGQEQVRNDLRQEYWVPSARAAVRRAWNSCQTCRNRTAAPQVPEMAPLPDCRTAAFQRPFTYTGVDYFGPMDVTVGRRREKRYGVLFTCLTTRAIHLEIAASLTTDSCIMAIRRMISRRGHPAVLHSDNGTNFRGAERELATALKELNEAAITRELTPRNIEWTFNPPAAPHMGGAWERLVRSVKVALRSILKERAPRDEVLATVMAEVECIVNGRPLTHVSIDHADAESLTPNHFLLGGNHQAVTPGIFNEKCLQKQWKFAQVLCDQFWKRWVREYLPNLTRRTKWHHAVSPVKVDDVVVIADPQFSRSCWPKGIVEAVYPGKDGRVRVADVRTAAGTFKRPVSRLCVLDVKVSSV